MTVLKPLPPGRFYCGPSALCAVTGEHPKGVIRTLINQRRNRAATTGIISTDYADLQHVLRMFGMPFVKVSLPESRKPLDESWNPPRRPRITLKDFYDLHAAQPANAGGVWIVNVTHHWVALDSFGYACDSRSHMPRPLASFKGARMIVKGALRVWPAPDDSKVKACRMMELERDMKERAARASMKKNGGAYAELRKVARAMSPDIDMRDDGDEIHVDAPTGFVFDGDSHQLSDYYGARANRPDAIARLIKRMRDAGKVVACDCGCADEAEAA